MKLLRAMISCSTKKPLIIFLIVVAISVALCPGIFNVKLDNDIYGYFNKNDETYINYKHIKEIFDISEAIVFISVASDNIYTYETLNFVYKLHTKLEESIKCIDNITSIINIEDITGENDTLTAYTLIPKKNNKTIIPKTDKELNLLKSKIESNDKFKAFMISNVENEKGIPSAFNIIIELKKSNNYDVILSNIEKIVNQSKDDRFTTHIYGDIFNSREMNNIGRNDALRQGGLVIFIICLIYFFNFKSAIGVIFPLLTNIISVFWIFCLMGYFNIKLSLIGMLILPLLIAIASSYGIHSLNQYYKESHSFTPENKKSQISKTMVHILKTIFIAGLTTIIGLSSLATSNIVHLKTFGIFAGIGVAISVLQSITLMPALLSVIRTPKKIKSKKFNDELIDKAIKKVIIFTINYRYVVFFFILALIIASIVGMFFISTDSSTSDLFVKGHRVRFLTDYFSDNFDGVSEIKVIIDANPKYEKSIRNSMLNKKEIINNFPKNEDSFSDSFNNTIQSEEQEPFDNPFNNTTQSKEQDPFDNPFDEINNNNENEFNIDYNNTNQSNTSKALNSNFLKKIDKLSKYAQSLKGVGRSYSFADIQKRFNYVMNNNNPNYEIIPDSDQVIIDYMEFFSGKDNNNNGLADSLESFINPQKNIVCITMKMKNVGDRFVNTGDYRRIKNKLSKYIENNFDTSKIDYYISGSAILSMKIQEETIIGQIKSIIFSLVVILIVTSILFKSIKIGLISLIPLLVAIVIGFGVMGFSGIILDTSTSIITAFAIGIGIDDTIHFILNLRKEIKENKDKNLSIERLIFNTLKNTSKAIIFTSLALILGFIVVVFSSFISIRNFSILVSLTMFNATIATLIFLPSIILIFPSLIKMKKKK